MIKLKKAHVTLLRLAIAISIIIYLIHKVDLTDFGATIAESFNHSGWLLSGVILFFFCLCLGIIRWKIILDTQDLAISWSRVFSIHFIGQFFNSFMIGATGGDLVKAFYAAKETHHKKTETVATVIIDRTIGLIVFCAIAGVMLVVKAEFYLSHWQTHIPVIIMLVMITAVVLGLVILFNINRFKDWPLFNRIRNHPLLRTQIKRLLISIQLYHQSTRALIMTTLLSLAAHVLLVLECYCLGRSFQIHLGFIDYLTVIPLVMAISALPITPGGLGIREGLTVTMLGAMNISNTQALPLSLMVYFISLAWGLVGGIIFLGYSAGSGHTLHDEMIELRHEASSENGDIWVTGTHE